MLSYIPHAIRSPLLWRGWGRLLSTRKKSTLFVLPSFGGVGGGSLSTLKKPTLLALPSLWEGLGVGFRRRGGGPYFLLSTHFTTSSIISMRSSLAVPAYNRVAMTMRATSNRAGEAMRHVAK